MWRSYHIFVIFGLVILILSCGTIPIEDRAPLRKEINERADETIDELISKNPEIQKQLDSSAGYFVGRVSGVKAPILGAGYGLGVLYDKEKQIRTYMDINRIDLGLGLATGTYRGLALFENRQELDKFRSGKWSGGLGAETVAGDKIATTATPVDSSLFFFILPETGAAFLATARLARISVNEDLTDTGISEVSIPNTGFEKADRQGDDAPRKWEHKLPFLAQKVVDEGYDLPLPYGIGLTFVNVDQEMLLKDLEVGINGREEEPFEFVAFDNASAQNNSLQLKIDAWLFPFMNVFGLLGKIDGSTPMDILLDGNDALDHLDIDCSGPLPDPRCSALEDKTITLPIDAPFSGNTYGIGTILAGGWNNWFIAIPISFTYADMDGTDMEGFAITVTPIGGKSFNLDRYGNISLFGGGNYLDADLTVTGQVSTPEEQLVIDYTLDQENKDEWNIVVGGNWDINKRWSLAAEYNGFTGSREAVIISFVGRF
jgi:hypothetical protein